MTCDIKPPDVIIVLSHGMDIERDECDEEEKRHTKRIKKNGGQNLISGGTIACNLFALVPIRVLLFHDMWYETTSRNHCVRAMRWTSREMNRMGRGQDTQIQQGKKGKRKKKLISGGTIAANLSALVPVRVLLFHDM